jgi:hypothetical protein
MIEMKFHPGLVKPCILKEFTVPMLNPVKWLDEVDFLAAFQMETKAC